MISYKTTADSLNLDKVFRIYNTASVMLLFSVRHNEINPFFILLDSYLEIHQEACLRRESVV